MRALVLGAGRVGQAIARDLAADPSWKVTAADQSARALESLAARAPVRPREADLSDPTVVHDLAGDYDLVVGALPSFLGYAALEAVLEAGRDVVDISFFAEDPFTLDELARRNGCVAVVDCGVAPGLDNLLLGQMTRQMERIERFLCYVGGLPVERRLPWEYKAPFAPCDVLAEYLRPARFVEHGEQRVVAPLGDLEPLDVPGVGTLEAFLTDGLRTLLATVEVPFMKEKTLRYPGHAEKIGLLAASGLLAEEPVQVGGQQVSPLALTSALLFPHWELREGEGDLTVLRVVVEGTAGGRRERHVWDLLDTLDTATGISSMARTTGYTCTAIARLVAEGVFARKGVSAPEHVGMEAGCHDRVLAYLEARGVRLEHRVEPL
ncbi:MAG TPA: saccharopine dehydrogenase C-terminal domain-containing protein, partial [Thermoanaerobaculia bacterium]|nr:saccharopine dehydrogenase C-terminal domain-containing protein [Thermoanaerobaculia bacterium]